jgi:hypothetical protein
MTSNFLSLFSRVSLVNKRVSYVRAGTKDHCLSHVLLILFGHVLKEIQKDRRRANESWQTLLLHSQSLVITWLNNPRGETNNDIDQEETSVLDEEVCTSDRKTTMKTTGIPKQPPRPRDHLQEKRHLSCWRGGRDKTFAFAYTLFIFSRR